MTKNISASIMGKLKNTAKNLKLPYNLILQLYVQERLLYRISISKFKNNFLLKGGLLLYSINGFKGRPTKDIDFLLNGHSNESSNLEKLFKEIIDIKVDDGVKFDIESLKFDEINKNNKYNGRRIKLTAYIGRAKIFLKIDIGSGDIVVPGPVNIEYPNLLEFERPNIYAYSLESVISEKFEAMVSLASINSRMKDFYDINFLIKKKEYDGEILKKAVNETFNRRNTAINKKPMIFSEQFKNNLDKQKQWNMFLDRIGNDIQNRLKFSMIINKISKFLQPVYNSIYRKSEFNYIWKINTETWKKKIS